MMEDRLTIISYSILIIHMKFNCSYLLSRVVEIEMALRGQSKLNSFVEMEKSELTRRFRSRRLNL